MALCNICKIGLENKIIYILTMYDHIAFSCFINAKNHPYFW